MDWGSVFCPLPSLDTTQHAIFSKDVREVPKLKVANGRLNPLSFENLIFIVAIITGDPSGGGLGVSL